MTHFTYLFDSTTATVRLLDPLLLRAAGGGASAAFHSVHALPQGGAD